MILTTTTKRYKLNNYIMEEKIVTVHNQVGILHTKRPLFTSDSGFHVKRFLLEINDQWTDKEGKIQTKTTMPEFSLLGHLHDLVDDIAIGAKINVAFKLKGRAWKTKDGKDGYSTEAEAINVKVLEIPSIDVNADVDKSNPFLGKDSKDDDMDLPF